MSNHIKALKAEVEWLHSVVVKEVIANSSGEIWVGCVGLTTPTEQVWYNELTRFLEAISHGKKTA